MVWTGSTGCSGTQIEAKPRSSAFLAMIAGSADSPDVKKNTPMSMLSSLCIVLRFFYSANLGQEILRGMRESASRGFYVVPRARDARIRAPPTCGSSATARIDDRSRHEPGFE